jgi:hypothetical protein
MISEPLPLQRLKEILSDPVMRSRSKYVIDPWID